MDDMETSEKFKNHSANKNTKLNTHTIITSTKNTKFSTY